MFFKKKEKDGVPYGATHYSTQTGIYYKKTRFNGIRMWRCGQWMMSGLYDVNIKGMIEL